MNLQDVYKKLAEDISYLVTAATENLKYDRTFRAQVIGTVKDGKCTISYKNKTYTARCRNPVSLNDAVWVCAPCNDWNSLYIQLSEIN
ncbi:hypothetical protein RZO55_05565 [Clostridium boliviensis]|uniref:Uncharacterized protein n=1 Tax=Clostridium boliviensis TaxID=318465 RepID=A0ABU4GJ57_9CLOT|nr:hypothetical protein [Clostridium boliviensis]MDW2797047.1 hypothetical protein [Clostridium boliviensis]